MTGELPVGAIWVFRPHHAADRLILRRAPFLIRLIVPGAATLTPHLAFKHRPYEWREAVSGQWLQCSAS